LSEDGVSCDPTAYSADLYYQVTSQDPGHSVLGLYTVPVSWDVTTGILTFSTEDDSYARTYTWTFEIDYSPAFGLLASGTVVVNLEIMPTPVAALTDE